MSVNYNNVLLRLQEERRRISVTQNEMGRLLRMGQSHYCKAEKGNKRFSLYELQVMCNLELDMFYIFSGNKTYNNHIVFSDNADYNQILSYIILLKIFIDYKILDKANNKKNNFRIISKRLDYLKYISYQVRDQENIFLAIRLRNGLTQNEMCRKIKVDVKKLRALESNKVFPDSEIVFVLYKEFDISPIVFLKDKKCIISELNSLLDILDIDSREHYLQCAKMVFKNNLKK